MSNVTFGSGSMVIVTNIGDTTGNLGGHWLCQRPSYYQFPDIEVPAGQAVAVSAGGSDFAPPAGALVVDGVAGIGGLDPAGGEVGLYSARSFNDASAIVSYVEWGSTNHPRSSVAIAAGIWPEGGFVASSSETLSLSAVVLPAVAPADWESG